MLSLNNLVGFGSEGAAGTAEATGDLFSWGSDSSGQLGNGAPTGDVEIPTELTGLPDGASIVSASFNSAFHMGLIAAGKLYMVGHNTNGQLGLNNTSNKNVFTAVTVNGDSTSVACGDDHTLSVNDGEVYGCGRDSLSQILGIGTSLTFEKIFATDSLKVFAGRNSSGVLTADNKIFTWGEQVGALTTDPSINKAPVNIADFDTSLDLEDTIFIDYALGNTTSIALDINGNAYTTFFRNSYGQAGAGSGGGDKIPTKVTSLVGTGVTKISAGRNTNYFISNGLLFAAGQGNNGEMGAATNTQVNTSFINIGGTVTDWIDVRAGQNYVIAMREGGNLYHSGFNRDGQQGNDISGSDEFGFQLITGDDTPLAYSSYVTAARTVYGIS